MDLGHFTCLPRRLRLVQAALPDTFQLFRVNQTALPAVRGTIRRQERPHALVARRDTILRTWLSRAAGAASRDTIQ